MSITIAKVAISILALTAAAGTAALAYSLTPSEAARIEA